MATLVNITFLSFQVQGMSFIAAVLILNLDTADAFIAFSNLLNKPCQMAFFRVDHGLVSMLFVYLSTMFYAVRTIQPFYLFKAENAYFLSSGLFVIRGTFELKSGNIWATTPQMSRLMHSGESV